MTPKASSAELMLRNFSKKSALMRQLQNIIENPAPQIPFELSEETRTTIEKFTQALLKRIDDLTAEMKETVNYLMKVSEVHPDAYAVLFYRYIASRERITPWLAITDEMHYGIGYIYNLHRKGLDIMDAILEKERAANG